MRREYDVVVAGHICLDLIPKFSEEAGKNFANLLKPGKLIEVGNATISTGGPVSNTGIALQKLGVKTTLMAKVSNDALGHVLLELLEGSGLAKGMTVVTGEQTSYTVVINPPGIDRIFLHCPGCNSTFSAHDVNYDLCKQTSLFHFGYPPLMRQVYADKGRDLVAIFRGAHEAGATTSLDMALPDPATESGRADWDGILRDLLPHVDIFMPSIEEGLFMLMRARYDELASQAHGSEMIDHVTGDDYAVLSDKILSYGARVAVIKSAHRGYYARTADAAALAEMGAAKPSRIEEWASHELWQPSYHTPRIASATGSGDSSIAGFLAAFVRGKSLADCMKYGCLVGWQNLQTYDAVSGIKTWEQTEADYVAGFENNPLDPHSAGWTHEAAANIWHGPNDRS